MGRPQIPFPNSLERFQKHMPKGRDVTMIVLKTHLLVEAEMNELLELSLPHPECIYRSRFSFIQKLRVLQAVSRDPEIHLLTRAIEALNELRNGLSHQLETPDFELLAARLIHYSFCCAYDKRSRVQADRLAPKKEDYSLTALKQASAYLIGRIGYFKNAAVTS
jgi:hypothetical protein